MEVSQSSFAHNYDYIRALPTEITRDEVVVAYAKSTNGWHESWMRSWHVLKIVRELLEKGTPAEVVLTVIQLLETPLHGAALLTAPARAATEITANKAEQRTRAGHIIDVLRNQLWGYQKEFAKGAIRGISRKRADAMARNIANALADANYKQEAVDVVPGE